LNRASRGARDGEGGNAVNPMAGSVLQMHAPSRRRKPPRRWESARAERGWVVARSPRGIRARLRSREGPGVDFGTGVRRRGDLWTIPREEARTFESSRNFDREGEGNGTAEPESGRTGSCRAKARRSRGVVTRTLTSADPPETVALEDQQRLPLEVVARSGRAAAKPANRIIVSTSPHPERMRASAYGGLGVGRCLAPRTPQVPKAPGRRRVRCTPEDP